MDSLSRCAFDGRIRVVIYICRRNQRNTTFTTTFSMTPVIFLCLAVELPASNIYICTWVALSSTQAS